MKYKKVVKEIDIVPEYVSEDYFSTKSLKNAVWQYILDHCHLSHEGQMKVTFFIPNEEEFWRRVKARETGKYKKYDLLQLHKRENNRSIEILALKARQKKSVEIATKINDIQKGGNIFKKVLVKICWLLKSTERKLLNITLKDK